MGISPIELQGTIQRIQDFSTIKQNEDNKPIVDQSNFQTYFQKEVNDKREQVNRGSEARGQDKKFDASEKGANEYHGNGGKKRAPEEPDAKNGQVILKKSIGGGFDIKI
ncbi:MAG: hypothetical protein PHP50_02400 [Lachnospiraceae bacterium]|nr:hypothetical protein [Lachnospiraceae bacterium]